MWAWFGVRPTERASLLEHLASRLPSRSSIYSLLATYLAYHGKSLLLQEKAILSVTSAPCAYTTVAISLRHCHRSGQYVRSIASHMSRDTTGSSSLAIIQLTTKHIHPYQSSICSARKISVERHSANICRQFERPIHAKHCRFSHHPTQSSIAGSFVFAIRGRVDLRRDMLREQPWRL